MIRVRFAPSPTGFLHVGSLRTYLYNWLFAKKNKGKMVLRIEDTDRKRYVEGATESLIKTLKQIGLHWDEGPFIQSQKIGDYRSLAQKLVDLGRAYYCFCSSEELEEMRQKQIVNKLAPQYDKRCRNLTEEETREKLKTGKPYVIRLKVPEQGTIKFKDLIRGEVKFDLKNIDDQVLLKSDGWPTYHLANVVDDHFMGITQVIRGEEWLPSTPKHILVYQAFKWPVPDFAHLPLLLNPDHSKLSKRQGDVAVEDYLAQGYLPETLINFLALLGWNPGNDQEIFNLKQLIKEFSLEKIQKSGAVFNREKLDWLNGHYIRQMTVNQLIKLCLPYLIQAGLINPHTKLKIGVRGKSPHQIIGVGVKENRRNYRNVKKRDIKKIVALEQERLKRLDEIGDLTGFFFIEKIDYDPGILTWKKTGSGQTEDNLVKIRDLLKKIPNFRFKAKNIVKALKVLVREKGTGEIFWPLRACLSGKKASPPPEHIAEILGKEKTLERINQAVDKLKKAE